jgi:hypothetical protein
MPARKRPLQTEPEPPAEEVAGKVDPAHGDDDFLRDLEKATDPDARKRLGLDPDEPGRGSRRTAE